MWYTSYLGDEADGGRLFQAENQQRLRGEKVFEELKEVQIIVGIRGEGCRSKLDPNQKGSYQTCSSCGQREPEGALKQGSKILFVP